MQNILETTIFSDKLDAENFVCDLVGRAEKRIKIWDPYVTKNTLQLISEGVGNKKVEVKILTSEPRIYPDLKHFLKSNISLRVKIIYRKTKIGMSHRFMIDTLSLTMQKYGILGLHSTALG